MEESNGSDSAKQDMIFKSAIVLQRPVLDPNVAVGFLSLPSDGLRVGQLIGMKWRIERLKGFDQNKDSQCKVSNQTHFCINKESVKHNFTTHSIIGILI